MTARVDSMWRTGRWITAGFLVAVVLVTGEINAEGAMRLVGSLSTDWYFLDDGIADRIQSYNALRASLTIPSTSTKYLQVRANLRYRKDLDDSPAAVSQFYVYETYVQSTGLISRTNLWLGRQFVYSNLGSGLVDGGRLQTKFGNRLQLEIFGGSQVSGTKPDEIRSVSKFGTAGARLSGRIDKATYWGVDGLLRRDDGSVSYSAVGVDLSHTHRTLQAYSQAAYDIANNRLASLRARVSVNPHMWFASGEFIWREPIVRSNSLFSVIGFDRYKLARLGLRRALRGALALDGSASLSFTGSVTTLHTTFGLTAGNWGFGWRHQNGRGTSSDGAYGWANIELSRQWSVFGNTDLSRYRVQELQESLSDAYSTAAGISFCPGKNFTITAEGQFLRNATSTSDLRLFLRVSKGFSMQRSTVGTRP